jgi:tRNA modification GTPase
LSALVDGWRQEVLSLSALVEAALDFADEDDVGGLPADVPVRLSDLRFTIAQWLDRPRAEALREGFRVVIAGPPNAGKSTLFNALVESEAAITAPIAGTTRDVLTHPWRFRACRSASSIRQGCAMRPRIWSKPSASSGRGRLSIRPI